MVNLFVEIDRLLQSGESLVLARIIRQSGSAPRSVGTKQLIRADGTLIGTIGGGLLEYEVVRKAAEVHATGLSAIIHFQLTGKDAAESEMLCGGLVDVFLERLDAADSGVKSIFANVARRVAEGSGAALVTIVQEGVAEVGRMLIEPDGAAGAAQAMPAPGIDPAAFRNERRPRLARLDEFRLTPQVFFEPLAAEPVLYLFGAGHVSTCVAPLARMAGFRVAVIDDRAEFANAGRFPSADQILVCAIEEAFRRVRISSSSYIVIVTRGHLHDRQALREALNTRAVYIGMIGSRRKRDLIYRSLVEEGLAPERLEQVHSPIGLDIGAETPEEIGISIVAELVQIRAGIEAVQDPLGRKRPPAGAARAEVR